MRPDVPSPRGIAAPAPPAGAKQRWPAIVGTLLTAAMLAGLARELLGSGLSGLVRAVPHDPLFYVAFAVLYVTPPLFDYIIFRHLWSVPPSAMVALAKKRIANEVVMGYSGEAYFYAWARQRAHIVAAPFSAVKDVSILSAMAGNAVTLAMIALALPLGSALIPPETLRYIYGSLAVIVATSVPFLIFSRRVFSLDRRNLRFVFAMHVARIVVGAIALALAWHVALPAVPLAIWLLLSAGRLLFSRLPLLPNKDLLFANFAILTIGKDDEGLSALIAFVAAAMLLVHVALILGFGAADLIRRHKSPR